MNDSGLFENKQNSIGFEPRVNIRKNDILLLIEKAQLDKDKAISNYSNLKINYNSLQNDYNLLQSKYNSLEIDLKKEISKSSFAEIKLQENISKLFSAEKKLSDVTIQKDILSNSNTILENQLSQLKSVYSDYKFRSNKEISFLKSNIEEIQKEKEALQKNYLSIKRELNQYQLRNKLLEKENESIKSDNDSLIKIIEEHNEIVKTSELKIASFDSAINEYKKQIDNLNLKIEKLKLENKIQKESGDKFKNFFNEKLFISDNNFEETLDNIRKNYEKKIILKLNDYNILKTDYINTKIDRDKFFMDYTKLKEEYEKNNEIFQKQYLDIKEKKKMKEIEMDNQIGHLTDKLNSFLEENMRLKSEKIELENIIKELKEREDFRIKLELKNKEIENEVNKKNEESLQENETLKNNNDK